MALNQPLAGEGTPKAVLTARGTLANTSKGDFHTFDDKLEPGDCVLLAESCSTDEAQHPVAHVRIAYAMNSFSQTFFLIQRNSTREMIRLL